MEGLSARPSGYTTVVRWLTSAVTSDDSAGMGAAANQIPETPTDGQQVGEDRRNKRTPELSRETWKDLLARLMAKHTLS